MIGNIKVGVGAIRNVYDDSVLRDGEARVVEIPFMNSRRTMIQTTIPQGNGPASCSATAMNRTSKRASMPMRCTRQLLPSVRVRGPGPTLTQSTPQTVGGGEGLVRVLRSSERAWRAAAARPLDALKAAGSQLPRPRKPPLPRGLADDRGEGRRKSTPGAHVGGLHALPSALQVLSQLDVML